ncbi:MAG TPA: hypothetical protein VFH68_08350 [Polyangia bacterium]|nr:hypothetical protein [Polyangia bacterium]
MKRAELDLFVNDQVQATEERVRSLHALADRVRQDPRLDELSRLRRAGLSLREALADIDRRFPPHHAENNTDSDE